MKAPNPHASHARLTLRPPRKQQPVPRCRDGLVFFCFFVVFCPSAARHQVLAGVHGLLDGNPHPGAARGGGGTPRARKDPAHGRSGGAKQVRCGAVRCNSPSLFLCRRLDSLGVFVWEESASASAHAWNSREQPPPHRVQASVGLIFHTYYFFFGILVLVVPVVHLGLSGFLVSSG